MLESNSRINGKIVLLHRSVSQSKDALVQMHKAELIKFLEMLRDNLMFEYQRIRFRNEVLWSEDDEYMPIKDKN